MESVNKLSSWEVVISLLCDFFRNINTSYLGSERTMFGSLQAGKFLKSRLMFDISKSIHTNTHLFIASIIHSTNLEGGENIYCVSGTVLDVRDTMGSKIYIFLDLQGANCRIKVQKHYFILQFQ